MILINKRKLIIKIEQNLRNLREKAVRILKNRHFKYSKMEIISKANSKKEKIKI